MKNIFKYIFIGFIQGITEFLPVSSSGHIVLAEHIINLGDSLLISITAHLGTLFAVMFWYRKRLIDLIKHPISTTNLNLLLATIPTIIVVVLFKSLIQTSYSVFTLVWGFIVSAALLIVSDCIHTKHHHINKSRSIIMGIGQSIAILPGISRSGTTLCLGLITGADRTEALDFSFLMSIPVIIGSGIFECLELINTTNEFPILGMIIIAISSFVFGLMSIKIMFNVIKKNRLLYFAIYLIALSLVILAIF